MPTTSDIAKKENKEKSSKEQSPEHKQWKDHSSHIAKSGELRNLHNGHGTSFPTTSQKDFIINMDQWPLCTSYSSLL